FSSVDQNGSGPKLLAFLRKKDKHTTLEFGEVMRGIFIKHILEDSPAGKNGTLKTGDRIVEVDGIDLRDASHEQAVEAIQKAGNPAVFMVQSIISRPKAFGQTDLEPEKTSFCNLPLPPLSAFSGISCDVAQSSSRELHMTELEKGRTGLGFSLAGNKDQSRMSVFIVGIDPNGAAGKDGRLQTADELLEINGQILYGRSHQNASSIIKCAPPKVKIKLEINTSQLNQYQLHGTIEELSLEGILQTSPLNKALQGPARAALPLRRGDKSQASPIRVINSYRSRFQSLFSDPKL
uniref:PDZ domain-containing protein n=1 Tax=Coturnix japonica TaxID=93934 RepID=A0A8C2TV40_COTJA